MASLQWFVFSSNTMMIAVLLALLLVLSWPFSIFARRKKPRLPPGPFKFPLVGNLPQLISMTHRSLGELSRRHGPLISLQVGPSVIVVASSAETAREVFKTHDVVFASRPPLTAWKYLFYGHKDVASAPYGDHWRQARKICVIHLLSAKQVQSYGRVREEEVASALSNISGRSAKEPINLRAVVNGFMSDVFCRVALGRKYAEGSKVVEEIGELAGEFFVEDFFPWLAWVSGAMGKHQRFMRFSREFDSFLDEVIEDHPGASHRPAGDMVDVLLALREDHQAWIFLTRDCMKAVILVSGNLSRHVCRTSKPNLFPFLLYSQDMFAGGTETTVTAVEWAMSELVRNQRVLRKAQDEVRAVAGAKPTVAEGDLDRMDYLKAVIKETLRLHPPFPLLIPHEATAEVEIAGFSVPAGTWVMVNVWAIGRDPRYWEAPEEFMPERFLNGSVDYRGKDFHYLPFGSGRRMCPGIAFASSAMELILANLLHGFDWKLPEGTSLEDIDMTEGNGILASRKSSLLLVAVPTDTKCWAQMDEPPA